MSLQTWKKEIDSYITVLLKKEPDEKNSILLNSLFGLQEHFNRMETTLQSDADHPSVSDNSKNNSENKWMLGMIEEELAGSEKYYEKFLKTNIAEYKNISADELRHSEFLIKQAREFGISEDKLQDYLILHGILMAKLI